MNDLTSIAWTLGELAILVLTLWFVVKALFFRRASTQATRYSHFRDGIFLLLLAFLWVGLGSVFLMNATFAGASVRVTHGILLIGGGVLLGILWGALRHLRQAFSRPLKPGPDNTKE